MQGASLPLKNSNPETFQTFQARLKQIKIVVPRFYGGIKLTGQRSLADGYSGAATIHTSQSQSHIATDSQSVSLSWCRTPSGAYDQKFHSRDTYL
jgi:hypothetical protein